MIRMYQPALYTYYGRRLTADHLFPTEEMAAKYAEGWLSHVPDATCTDTVEVIIHGDDAKPGALSGHPELDEKQSTTEGGEFSTARKESMNG